MQYREKMEKQLGRKLNGRKEHVHHINGDRTNNDLSNLMVLSASDHRRIHGSWRFINGELHKICSECGALTEDNPKSLALCSDCRFKHRQTKERFYYSLDKTDVERIGYDTITNAVRQTIENLLQ